LGDAAADWQAVYDFWFPPGLENADPETHRRMFGWWFGGGATPALNAFAPVLEAARAGLLDHWSGTALGRLSLIIVLDQFPRGLFAGTPEAYAGDPAVLRLAEEGLRNGHYDALSHAWEKTFFFMPLAHAEGADHRDRLRRVVAMTRVVNTEAPERLQPLYRHSINQALGHLDVISRFGRFPHRNAILQRMSTADEDAYLEKGDFVHKRQPPS
jgi:uncharacterized protein (DUF924 family)